MQFTYLTLLSLVAFALAAPVAQTQTQPDGEGAAMSNASGDVVTFNSADVYKAASNGDVA